MFCHSVLVLLDYNVKSEMNRMETAMKNILGKTLTVITLGLALAGTSVAQQCPPGNPYTGQYYQQPVRQARPTFNHQVGVPIRWVDVPIWGQGYGYQGGSGHPYGAPGYGFTTGIYANPYNNGYYNNGYYSNGYNNNPYYNSAPQNIPQQQPHYRKYRR